LRNTQDEAMPISGFERSGDQAGIVATARGGQFAVA